MRQSRDAQDSVSHAMGFWKTAALLLYYYPVLEVSKLENIDSNENILESTRVPTESNEITLFH